jgi:hypothetical protein
VSSEVQQRLECSSAIDTIYLYRACFPSYSLLSIQKTLVRAEKPQIVTSAAEQPTMRCCCGGHCHMKNCPCCALYRRTHGQGQSVLSCSCLETQPSNAIVLHDSVQTLQPATLSARARYQDLCISIPLHGTSIRLNASTVLSVPNPPPRLI